MIINWIIIGVFVFIGLIFIKVDHHARKIKILVIIAIGFIIYFSLAGIFSSEQVDITSPKGIVNAVYIYFGWIGQTTLNLWNIGTDTINLVGNAVKINNSDGEKHR